jgi:hypothetical protein
MKKNIFFFLLSSLFIVSCKNNKTNEEKDAAFFPVLSFIKSQVAHVDTSLYRIIKIVKKDSTADTSYLKREDFREAAKDFLSIPDISSEELRDDYTETKLFIEDLDQVALNYMPKEPNKEITRQEVMIKAGSDGDKVQSIFINRIINNRNGSTQKILFWEVDKQFRIITLTQLPDSPETKETIEVKWNDFSSS